MPIRWDASRTALASIAEAVGRTPLIRLNRATAEVRPEVFLKLEWYGPTGSLKDRIYLYMFERAEARGELVRGMRVLECSTGNAGIACAFVAAVKGYACTIVMPEGMSDERKKIMRAYGADLVFTPGGARVGAPRDRGHRRRVRAREPRRLTPLRRDHDDHRRERLDGAAARRRGGDLLRHLDRMQRRGGADPRAPPPGARADRDDGERHRAAILHHGAVRRGQARRRPRA